MLWCTNQPHPVQLAGVAKRSYDRPDCGLAVALDLLGERWTLLIIRELMLGPQRYTDLSDGLTGLSTNLLAGRLRHLEDVGVVQRRELPPPAACTVYELTAIGRELEPLVIQLAQWGAKFADCTPMTDSRAAAFALVSRQSPASTVSASTVSASTVSASTVSASTVSASTVSASTASDSGDCQIQIDGFSITARVEGGRVHARAHAPATPVAVVRLTGQTYGSLVAGDLSWSEALTDRHIEVDGDIGQLGMVFGALDRT